MEKILTKYDFDHYISSNELLAVHFQADWAMRCRKMQFKFEEMATEFSNIKFVTVNIDENTATAEAENISQLPTFKFYKKGMLLDEFLGASDMAVKNKLTALSG